MNLCDDNEEEEGWKILFGVYFMMNLSIRLVEFVILVSQSFNFLSLSLCIKLFYHFLKLLMWKIFHVYLLCIKLIIIENTRRRIMNAIKCPCLFKSLDTERMRIENWEHPGSKTNPVPPVEKHGCADRTTWSKILLTVYKLEPKKPILRWKQQWWYKKRFRTFAYS